MLYLLITVEQRKRKLSVIKGEIETRLALVEVGKNIKNVVAVV